MIELPETYVLAGQINETLIGKTIANVTVGASPHAFAWYSENPEGYHEKLSGKKVTKANPGTGYTCGGNTEILIEDMLLVLSTPIKYHKPGDKLPKKHQLLIEFEDESHLSCTVQMWGSMFLSTVDLDGLPVQFTVKKAPTPLDDAFDKPYFMGLSKDLKPTISAKALLATEQRIPGLGNGVLHDILLNARVHPKTKLEALSERDMNALYDSVKSTLQAMVLNGGRDTEKDLYGVSGGYKTLLSSKTLDKPCAVCGGSIRREAFLGGNVYYCPVCQPLKTV